MDRKINGLFITIHVHAIQNIKKKLILILVTLIVVKLILGDFYIIRIEFTRETTIRTYLKP